MKTGEVVMARARCGIGVGLFAAMVMPLAVVAQDIADIDYEHLSLRGIGFDCEFSA